MFESSKMQGAHENAEIKVSIILLLVYDMLFFNVSNLIDLNFTRILRV